VRRTYSGIWIDHFQKSTIVAGGVGANAMLVAECVLAVHTSQCGGQARPMYYVISTHGHRGCRLGVRLVKALWQAEALALAALDHHAAALVVQSTFGWRGIGESTRVEDWHGSRKETERRF
jgi:hypothetical protein